MRSKNRFKPLDHNIYVTKPLIPDRNIINNFLDDIIDSGWITNSGKYHDLLEKLLKDHLKVNSISLLNNGTTALLIALKAFGIQGKMITTPFTFAATPQSISWMGIEPVFVDVDMDTMNMDPSLIEGSLTDDVTGLLPVHVFGRPCDVKTIEEIADKNDLITIYDGAHAFGTEISDIGIGNYGDMTMFSLHATKLFNTIEGGALTCKTKHMKERIDRMRNFGIGDDQSVDQPGINGKLNEIQSAWGLANLNQLDRERKKRQIIKKIYEENLSNIDGITLNDQKENVRNSLQYFVVRIKKKDFGRSRDEIHEILKEYNIYARKYFYPLCSNYKFFKKNPTSNKKNLKNANIISEEVLSLPFYGSLDPDDVEVICEIIKHHKSK